MPRKEKRGTISQKNTKTLPSEAKTIELPVQSQELTNKEKQAIIDELVALYQSGKITEMIKWYEASGELAPRAAMERRPLFKRSDKLKGRLQNTGIAVDPEILERAVEKMRGEQSKVGKSLSQLVEFLLWQYIGSPEDLVEN